MNRLPPALTHTIAPQTWSPSQLVLGMDCRLRAVFAASDSIPSLITHPRAAVGAVMHKLLENAARGVIRRNDDLHSAVEAEFHRLLSAQELALGSSADTAHFGSLSQCFSEFDWHNHVPNTSFRSGIALGAGSRVPGASRWLPSSKKGVCRSRAARFMARSNHPVRISPTDRQNGPCRPVFR